MAGNEERLRVIFSAVDDGLTRQMDRMMDQAREMERIYKGLAGTQATTMNQMNSNAQKQAQYLQGTSSETRKLQDSYTTLSRTQANEAKRMENVGSRAAVQSARRMQDTGKTMMKTGAVLTAGLTVPLVAFGKQSVESSREYDAGMKDVQKVTDMTDSEMAALGAQVDELSRRWGINSSETLATVEAYGQMGVANEDLAQATNVSTQMQKATNLTAEESALIFGRLSSVMGTSVGDYDRLGSSIVALGNTTGATESEIAHLMERMSGTANVVGITEAELAGLSASMAEAGITAERGGTAMSKTMQDITTAVSEGGEQVEAFARVAGMSADEFSQSWADDPMNTLKDFIGGLNELDAQGEDTTAIMAELGITNQGQIAVIQALMGNYDGLTDNLETANRGWEENTAMTEEANTAMEKQEAKVAVLAVVWDQFKRRIGDVIEQALQPIIDALIGVIDWLSGLSDETLTVITIIGGLLAALGPVLIILGALTKAWGILTTAAITFQIGVAPLIGIIVGIVAAIAALIAAGIWLVNNWDDIKARGSEIWGSFKQFFSDLWASIVETSKEAWSNFKEWLSELWTNIKTTTMETWNSIKEFFTVTIPEIVNSVTEWFRQLPEKLLEIWNSIITAVVDWASSMWEKAVEAGRGFVERVAEQVGRMPEDFAQLLGMVIGIVIGWVLKMISRAIEVGTEFVGNIFKWFRQLPGRIGEFLSSVWTRVSTWGSNMITKAIETGTNFFNSISEWFSQLPGRVGSFITDVYNRVTTWASNMWNKAREAGSQFLTNIINWFQQLPGRVQTWLLQTLSRVTSWGSDLMARGRQAGQKLVNAVVNAVKSLPGKMLTFGKDVVKGFWNGINSLGGWIKGKVSGFFNGIMDGVKSIFKFGSPSKVFEQYGKWVDEGFGKGIEKGSRDAIRPMEKMMDNVISIGESANIDPLIGVNGSLARTNARINSRVDHNIDQMTTTPQPANITVNMGNRAYKTFIRDITEEQDQEIRLELNYG